MRIIKRLLFKILGHKRYLIFVSRCFIILYSLGVLRLFRKFDTHYLAGKMVSRGDSIIDIGANVGYYSTIFANKTGTTGKVTSVEPIPVYRKTLEINSRRFSNIKILPYALGDHNGTLKMGIPGGDATRHGLTRVLNRSEAEKIDLFWEVEIKKASELFIEESRVDYIKCDIEGYEDIVMPELYGLVEKFRPVIQIELAEANIDPISGRLKQLGYSPFQAMNRKLVPFTSDSKVSNDMVFLTEELSSKFIKILGSRNKFKYN